MAGATPRRAGPDPTTQQPSGRATQDRAPNVARWLVEEAAPITDPWSDVHGVAEGMRERWPDLSPDEVNRAVDIATEIKLAAIYAGEEMP